MAKAGVIARCGALLAALAMVVAGTVVPVGARSSAHPPILAKPEQRAREAVAMRIYKSAKFQAELKQAKALFAKSPVATTPDAKATIKRASEAIAFSAALYAANHDTLQPNILWGTNAGHRWMGHTVPTSGYALDSPDNVYRSATFDGAGRYLVRGTVHGAGPAQQTFVVYRGMPGVTRTMTANGRMDEIAGIKSEAIVRDVNGNFTITIDADPANGRANHLQVPRELDAMQLTIRDSLNDWERQLPAELSIERLDALDPAPAPRSDEDKIALAVVALSGNVPFWLSWFENYVYKKPLNEIPQPWMRVQGWGMTQQGRFAFGKDEAWLITLDPLGAKFFNMQISDPWTKAVEYVNRTGSFNGSQAVANPDGTITMVAASRDPGVHNWLDTAGLTSGTYQARWQSLAVGVTGTNAVREARVVKLSQLREALPAGTRFVTRNERSLQQRERAKSYKNRLR